MEDFTEIILQAKNLDDLEKFLNDYHMSMLTEHSYDVCVQLYKQKLLPNIQEWLYQSLMAKELGSYTFGEKPTTEVIGNLEYATKFLTAPPQQSVNVFVWDKMPDMLTDKDLSNYLGLSLATIKSKRSRGELPPKNTLGLTSKKSLMEMDEQLAKKENTTRKKIDSFKIGKNK